MKMLDKLSDSNVLIMTNTSYKLNEVIISKSITYKLQVTCSGDNS